MAEVNQTIQGAADLAELATLKITAIAVPTSIKLEDLTLKNNVRDVSEYNLPPLMESIIRNGFRSSHPIVVHEDADGTKEVLAGNRRTNALRSLTPEQLALALPDGKVPCVVYKGLSPVQVEILRCDHGSDEDRLPLSKFGLFVAVARLQNANIGQAAIAQRLGMFVLKDGVKKPNRSLVQVYAAAATLPDRVKLLLKDYWLHGNGTIRQKDVMPLQKIWNEEWTAFGIYGNEGPKFRAAVDAILGKSPEEAKTTKALTPKEADDRSKVMTCVTTRLLLAAAVQNDGSMLANLDRELLARERTFKQLDWLMAHKSKQITKLLEEAQEAIDTEAKTIAAAAEATRAAVTPSV